MPSGENCSHYFADPENYDRRDGTCGPCNGCRIERKCDLELGKMLFILLFFFY